MNDYNDSIDYIGVSYCDTCGDKCIGTHLHDAHGTEVVFACANCMSHSFERVAREDIDRWLAGGNVSFCAS